jgi:hypothetical protein
MGDDRVEPGVWEIDRVGIAHLEGGTGRDACIRRETLCSRNEGRTLVGARHMAREAGTSGDRASDNTRAASNLQHVCGG